MTVSTAELHALSDEELNEKLQMFEISSDLASANAVREVLHSRSTSEINSGVATPVKRKASMVELSDDDFEVGEVKRVAKTLGATEIQDFSVEDVKPVVGRQRPWHSNRNNDNGDATQIPHQVSPYQPQHHPKQYIQEHQAPQETSVQNYVKPTNVFGQAQRVNGRRQYASLFNNQNVTQNVKWEHTSNQWPVKKEAIVEIDDDSDDEDRRRFETFDQPCRAEVLPDNVQQMIQFIHLNPQAEFSNDHKALVSQMRAELLKAKRELRNYSDIITHSRRKYEDVIAYPMASDPRSEEYRVSRYLTDQIASCTEQVDIRHKCLTSGYELIRQMVRKRPVITPQQARQSWVTIIRQRDINVQQTYEKQQMRAVAGLNGGDGGGLFNSMPNEMVPGNNYNDWAFHNRGNIIRGKNDQDEEAVANLFKEDKFNHDMPKEDRMQTPEGMKSKLMEHQRIGLSWLYAKEQDGQGCILADDMGLGKTVQTIALIMANKSPDEECRTTLIVAPVALLNQWANEISRHVLPSHKLKTYIHHRATNPKVHDRWQDLQRYDIVITTYEYVANDYAAHGGLFQGQEDRGAPIQLDKSPMFRCKWWRVVLDEAQLIKNRQTKRSQAICELKADHRLCLSGTPMQNDVDEYFSFMRFLVVKPYDEYEKFSANIGRGLKNNNRSAECMKRLQALITKTLLRRTKTSRIDNQKILNLPERHVETDQSTFNKDQQEYYDALQAKAQIDVNKYLNSKRSGNKAEASYSCVLAWLTRLRQACCHPILIEKESVKDENSLLREGSDDTSFDVVNKEFGASTKSRIKRMLQNEETFNCPICLEDLEYSNVSLLAPCGHHLCQACCGDFFGQMARNGQALCPSCQGPITNEKTVDLKLFQLVVVEGKKKKDIRAMRDAEKKAMREREQNRRQLIRKKRDEKQNVILDDFFDFAKEEKKPDSFDSAFGLEKDGNEEKVTGVFDGNGHDAAGDAAGKHDEHHIPMEIIKQLSMEEMFPEGWISSSKIDNCMQLIRQIMRASVDEKVIVFSQFTSFLDLLSVPLFNDGLDHLRYDGSMNSNDRTATVKTFMEDIEQRIMLLSLRAGNVGLTLTAANHVIILDPFWNPYVEEQAIDRAHRIGQQRAVNVHKLVVHNTVEDRILELQNKKKELIDAALDEGELKKASRLGSNELRYLFGMGGDAPPADPG